MRIAFDAKRAYRNNSGLGNYSRDLVTAMVRQFSEDEYFLFSPQKATSGIAFPPEGLEVNEIGPEQPFDRMLPSVWRLKGMVKDLGRHKIDLYHGLSHELPLGIGKTNIRKVVTMHDLIFKRFPEFYKAADLRIYERKYKHALQEADRIIAISEQTREDLLRYYKLDPERIEVIYQGIHPSFFEEIPEESLQSYRKKEKLEGTFLLTVGAGNPRKNLSRLLEALKSFVPQARPCLVVAARENRYLKEIQRQCKSLELDAWVQFKTDVPSKDLPKLYKAAAVTVIPSLFEGFGLPVGESLACGTPVVTSKGTCFEEVGGEGALYTDPLNPAEIAAAIQAVLTKRELRERLSADGQAYVQRFAVQDHAFRVREVYRDLVGS